MGNGKPPTKLPLLKSLETTKEKSKELRTKVKESLSSLTPRENIYTLPNILTATRLIAAPVVGYLVLHEQHVWALGLFAYAGVTDLIDGWIARKWKLQTVVGTVIDPMADKTLMTVLTITLAMNGALPVYLATLILGRDVSLALAAIYYRYASLPAPKTFTRYWDFSLPSAEVHPTTLSKLNTLLQLLLIGSTLAVPVITADSHHLGILGHGDVDAAMTAFQYLVAATTVWSGMSYAFLKKAVVILGTNEELKRKQGRRGRAVVGLSYAAFVGLAVWLAARKDGATVREEALAE
ncbi:CDP-alcohol phosphatidyltransferase-domain-containing protein [Cryomyces antarcticus]